MLFQVLGHVFATTDLQNDMVNPAELMLCQWLTQCPVLTLRDVASGIFVAGILLDYSVESKRIYPEVISFLGAALTAFAPSSFISGPYSDKFSLGSFQYDRFAAQCRSILKNQPPSSSSNAEEQHRISWRIFQDDNEEDSSHTKITDISAVASLLRALYEMVNTIAERVRNIDQCHHSAAPEVLYPLLHVLQMMRPHDAPWHESFQLLHLKVLENVSTVVSTVQSVRVPLLWRKMMNNVVDSKAPRFEAHYVIKKDQDSDRDRAKLKQLTRQLKREKKAAMRELRRDSAFLDQEKFKEKQAVQTEKRAERVKNFAWLEAQQATINEQVRKGKGLMKGGGSGAAKGPRPGRR